MMGQNPQYPYNQGAMPHYRYGIYPNYNSGFYPAPQGIRPQPFQVPVSQDSYQSQFSSADPIRQQKKNDQPWYVTVGKEALKIGAIVGASVLGGVFLGPVGAVLAGSITSGAVSAIDQKVSKGKIDWGTVAIDTALGAIPGGAGSTIVKAGQRMLGKEVLKAGIKKGAVIGSIDGALMGYAGGTAHSAYDSYKKTGELNLSEANRAGLGSILPGAIGGAIAGGAFTAIGNKLNKKSSSQEPDSIRPDDSSPPKRGPFNWLLTKLRIRTDNPAMKITNFHQVDDVVFRGAMPESPKAFARLKAQNVDTIIDLRGTRTTSPSDFAFETRFARENGIKYHSIKMDSKNGPDPAGLHQLFWIIQDARNRGAKVYVHCRQGIERTGSMIGAYQMAYQGYTPNQAYAAMKNNGYSPHMHKKPHKDFLFSQETQRLLPEVQESVNLRAKAKTELNQEQYKALCILWKQGKLKEAATQMKAWQNGQIGGSTSVNQTPPRTTEVSGTRTEQHLQSSISDPPVITHDPPKVQPLENPTGTQSRVIEPLPLQQDVGSLTGGNGTGNGHPQTQSTVHLSEQGPLMQGNSSSGLKSKKSSKHKQKQNSLHTEQRPSSEELSRGKVTNGTSQRIEPQRVDPLLSQVTGNGTTQQLETAKRRIEALKHQVNPTDSGVRQGSQTIQQTKPKVEPQSHGQTTGENLSGQQPRKTSVIDDVPIEQRQQSRVQQQSIEQHVVHPPQQIVPFKPIFDGIDITSVDFKQGNMQDCFFLSAINTVQHHKDGAKLLNRIGMRELINGDYEVRFPGHGKEVTVKRASLDHPSLVQSETPQIRILEQAYKEMMKERVLQGNPLTGKEMIRRMFGEEANNLLAPFRESNRNTRTMLEDVFTPESLRGVTESNPPQLGLQNGANLPDVHVARTPLDTYLTQVVQNGGDDLTANLVNLQKYKNEIHALIQSQPALRNEFNHMVVEPVELGRKWQVTLPNNKKVVIGNNDFSRIDDKILQHLELPSEQRQEALNTLLKLNAVMKQYGAPKLMEDAPIQNFIKLTKQIKKLPGGQEIYNRITVTDTDAGLKVKFPNSNQEVLLEGQHIVESPDGRNIERLVHELNPMTQEQIMAQAFQQFDIDHRFNSIMNLGQSEAALQNMFGAHHILPDNQKFLADVEIEKLFRQFNDLRPQDVIDPIALRNFRTEQHLYTSAELKSALLNKQNNLLSAKILDELSDNIVLTDTRTGQQIMLRAGGGSSKSPPYSIRQSGNKITITDTQSSYTDTVDIDDILKAFTEPSTSRPSTSTPYTVTQEGPLLVIKQGQDITKVAIDGIVENTTQKQLPKGHIYSILQSGSDGTHITIADPFDTRGRRYTFPIDDFMKAFEVGGVAFENV
jgi:protein-tyrosine phosphatase